MSAGAWQAIIVTVIATGTLLATYMTNRRAVQVSNYDNMEKQLATARAEADEWHQQIKDLEKQIMQLQKENVNLLRQLMDRCPLHNPGCPEWRKPLE